MMYFLTMKRFFMNKLLRGLYLELLWFERFRQGRGK
jgi:hypothetical protein